MYYLILMQVLKPSNHVGKEKLGLSFIKFPSFSDMVAQISTINVIHK